MFLCSSSESPTPLSFTATRKNPTASGPNWNKKVNSSKHSYGNSIPPYLVSDSNVRSRAEHLAGDTYAHLTISRSELHLQDEINVEVIKNSGYHEEWRLYRVGDEVADDLLNSVNVHVEDQAPLRSERFMGHHIQAALLIYEGQVMK